MASDSQAQSYNLYRRWSPSSAWIATNVGRPKPSPIPELIVVSVDGSMEPSRCGNHAGDSEKGDYSGNIGYVEMLLRFRSGVLC
ncbi:hypothetical protein TIFTF001_012152 [Ficus carica]|uniref:Uncharacterized protein n=1 Tax=Ficus carica TaxID=3494 RepID=A0AA88ABS9_FICCA|nr:hypothetical protein TIFTF001_012152 [Ficus carica]